MLSLGGTHRVFVWSRPVDFRKAHDGLCAIVRDQFDTDPFSGDVFTFFNSGRDRIKLLLWDRNGFWLLYKRLEKGTFPFQFQQDGSRVEVERAQLSMLLEGIEWKNMKRSSRFAIRHDITKRDGHPTHPPR